MAYGASNLVEAGQDIYYGSIGDPYTVAFNPIRDTVFCGNQGLYDLWGGVATDVAGMLIPIGIASKAAKAAEIGSKAAKSASLASKLTKPNVVQHVASGVHGAVSAGTGSVKQQFYEKGSLEAIDWGEVAGKSTVGGIIGVGTSYGGEKLSQGTTYLLSKNATVSSLLYSESAATRAASNFVVSGTAEVVSGGITRFAGGVLTTGGNVKEAWAQAINPQSIIFDAALGGTTGSIRSVNDLQALKKPLSHEITNTVSAEETNQWFKEKDPNYNPPYKPETKVNEIVLQEDSTFVRVYDKKGSKKHGSWVMRYEDIKGLTPQQIRDKYALPDIPKYICDVELKAGTHLREGVANPIEGWGNGGGTQFDLKMQRIGEFKNERVLGGE